MTSASSSACSRIRAEISCNTSARSSPANPCHSKTFPRLLDGSIDFLARRDWYLLDVLPRSRVDDQHRTVRHVLLSVALSGSGGASRVGTLREAPLITRSLWLRTSSPGTLRCPLSLLRDRSRSV